MSISNGLLLTTFKFFNPVSSSASRKATRNTFHHHRHGLRAATTYLTWRDEPTKFVDDYNQQSTRRPLYGRVNEFDQNKSL